MQIFAFSFSINFVTIIFKKKIEEEDIQPLLWSIEFIESRKCRERERERKRERKERPLKLLNYIIICVIYIEQCDLL